jgi:hypothetical protein
VSQRSSDRRRAVAFGAVVGVCALVAAVAVFLGVRDSDSGEGAGSATAAQLLPKASTSGSTTVLFRSLARRGVVGLAPAAVGETGDTRAGTPVLSGLRCERVHYAAGHGICVARGSGFAAGYRVKLFGAGLKVDADLPVEGIPSRARVSPDGRYGATTLFVTGHAYAEAGTFSTATTLFDLVHRTKIAELEQFTTYNNGKVVTATDANYWGVTFAPGDSDTFYATLATGGKTHLIRGSVSRRRAEVLHDNVECPSLSPDGKRIAFKKRTGSKSAAWHLTVLDLATMRETPLAESHSVDDQAEWLDDEHVLYGRDGAVWAVAADGSGQPQRYLAHADSPSVVRP